MAEQATATGGQEVVSQDTQTLAEAVKDAATTEGTGEQTDETASQSAGEGEGDTEQEHADKPKGKGGFQKRIEKLSRKIELAEQEKEYWREQALRTPQAKTADTAKATGDDPEPQPKDFDDMEGYLRAVRAWDRKQVAKEVRSDWEKAQKAEREKSEKAKQSESWNKKLETARSEYDDFDDVLESANVPVTPALAEALLASEKGADIAYYLGKNEAEALRISKLTPIQAAVELGKIEARIAGEKSATVKEPTPVTKAPKPPTPVSKGSSAKAVDIYDPNLPFKDFVKERERMRAKEGN